MSPGANIVRGIARSDLHPDKEGRQANFDYQERPQDHIQLVVFDVLVGRFGHGAEWASNYFTEL